MEYEAHWVGDGSLPNTQVHVGTSADVGCPSEDEEYYELIALQAVDGTPTYGPYGRIFGSGINFRSIAGDAILNTRRALETVFRTLEYDGIWSAARVVVNATACMNDTDNAYCIPHREPRAPEQSVAICPIGDTQSRFSAAAALDVVAHEWGHRVVYDFGEGGDAVFDRTMNYGAELHEGFADLVGHVAEWSFHPWRQGGSTYWRGDPPGDLDCSEFEVFDWCGGEDFHKSLIPGRRVDQIQRNVPAYQKQWSLHADEDYQVQRWQAAGNRLGAALRLLAAGGDNPICGEGNMCGSQQDQPCSGCDVVVSGIGFERAAKVLFDSLYYLPKDSHWDNLDQAAVFATYALYTGEDPPHALSFQHSVADAFAAIGYANTPPCFVRFGVPECVE